MQQTVPANLIRPHMPVISSDGRQFGMADHLDDKGTVKLTRDDQGRHHWSPILWVSRVDDLVYVDRTGDRVMKDWSTAGP